MRPVNLLPEQHRARGSGSGSVGAHLVIGVLTALVVMVAAYSLTANAASSRQAQAAKAGQEAQALEAQTASLGRFGDVSQLREARLASVRELAGGRFDWERFMRELSLVLPRGSWIREVDASAGGAAATGQANGLPSGRPSAKLTGCTPRQPETAKLMVRLRRMHRVDDVALAQSAQEASGGAATLAGCGRLYAFDLTVTFVDAAPAGGAGKRVPASLGGGS